jgi:ATP-dependent exoDNAse (exonuclease V) alpha subunit
MAATRQLDWLTRYARDRGAVVRLLGDPAQLSSVQAGGALRLLANDVGAVQLSDLHRFTDPAEAAATLQIRDGDLTAVGFYRDHGRLHGGGRDAMLDAAYHAWAADIGRGLDSVLVASSADDVRVLNQRAQHDRIRHGFVRAGGTRLRDGTLAAVGDQVVTRRNDRTLPVGGAGEFVKNGDVWVVGREHRNGDLTVTRSGTSQQPGHRSVRLPARYVAAHVELGYAVTATRAQGCTVDSSHVVLDSTTTRPALYVAATRGRDGAHVYAVTDHGLTLGADHPPAAPMDPADLLTSIIRVDTAERSATEILREGQADALAQRRRRRTTDPPSARAPQPRSRPPEGSVRRTV